MRLYANAWQDMMNVCHPPIRSFKETQKKTHNPLPELFQTSKSPSGSGRRWQNLSSNRPSGDDRIGAECALESNIIESVEWTWTATAATHLNLNNWSTGCTKWSWDVSVGHVMTSEIKASNVFQAVIFYFVSIMIYSWCLHMFDLCNMQNHMMVSIWPTGVAQIIQAVRRYFRIEQPWIKRGPPRRRKTFILRVDLPITSHKPGQMIWENQPRHLEFHLLSYHLIA